MMNTSLSVLSLSPDESSLTLKTPHISRIVLNLLICFGLDAFVQSMKPADVCHFPTMLYFLFKVFLLLLLILIYCEFLIYYFVLLACSWPQLSKLDQDFTVQPPADAGQKPLRIMLIADAHLLGSRRTHWFDRLRNEWQLHRSFQSAQFIFEPDLIFFVGDVTADGELCTDREWNATVQRFQSIFSLSPGRDSYVLAGNHDIGLHYSVSDARLRRFEQSFHAPHVRLITIDSHQAHFVLINSMAFEGDHCRLCERAERELYDVVEQLNRTGARTKPILLSHFPLYRPSDANCSQLSSSSPLLQVSCFLSVSARIGRQLFYLHL